MDDVIKAFREELRLQVALLADSCNLYDSGKDYQFKSISTRLYIIFVDMARSPLWKTVSHDKGLFFLSTAEPFDETNLIPFRYPLTKWRTSTTEVLYHAAGSQITFYSVLSLAKWLDEEVARSSAANTITRRKLIHQVRNYDGSSHGPLKSPSPEYINIKSQRHGISATFDGILLPVTAGPIEATARQVAHETICLFMWQLYSSNDALIDYEMTWPEWHWHHPVFVDKNPFEDTSG